MFSKFVRVFTLMVMGLTGLVGMSNCSSIPVRVENVDAITQRFEHQHVEVFLRGTPVPDREVILTVAGLAQLKGVTDSKGVVIFELDENFQSRAARIEIQGENPGQPISANVVLKPDGENPVVIDLDPNWVEPAEPGQNDLAPTPESTDHEAEEKLQPGVALDMRVEPQAAAFPFHEDFFEPHEGWPFGRQTINSSDIELQIYDGSLVEIIHAFGGDTDHRLVQIFLPCDSIRDLRINVDMAFQDAFPDNPVGFSIIFRQRENNDQYIARFGEAGDFTLFAYHNGEIAIVNHEGEQSVLTALNSDQGAFNSYSVMVVGSKISVFINGALISETVNELIAEPGRIALAVDGTVGQSARIEIAEVYVTDTP